MFFEYVCEISQGKQGFEPVLYPFEREQHRIDRITYEVTSKQKLRSTICILTTHRLIFYMGMDGIAIPLEFIRDYKKGGGMFHSPNITVFLHEVDQNPNWLVQYYKDVKKQATEPVVPIYPKQFVMKFKDKVRDSFLKHLDETLDAKYWQSIAVSQKIEEEKRHKKAMEENKIESGGLAGLRKLREKEKERGKIVETSFDSIKSLRDNAEELIRMAEKVKVKLTSSKEAAMSDQMQEIQSVLMDLGALNASLITKQASGSKYFTELAKDLAKILDKIIEKFKGIITLMDLFCIYNRARGTDPISPQDLYQACCALPKVTDEFEIFTFPSGVEAVRSKKFSSEQIVEQIVKLLERNFSYDEMPNYTADQLAQELGISIFLIDEILRMGESQGAFCKDASVEGVKYYANLFLKQL